MNCSARKIATKSETPIARRIQVEPVLMRTRIKDQNKGELNDYRNIQKNGLLP